MKKIKYDTIISGAYLDKNFGNSLRMFKKDNIKIGKKIKFKSSNKKISSWAFNFGEAVKKYSKALEKNRPDIMVLTGDRVETLAMCITCSYMNIPTAHIQAGDKSGHIDDLARGAIAKFANIHFASCIDSTRRLINLGEMKERIFNVGAPQLDDIKKFLGKKIEIKKKLENILIIFHPVLNEREFLKYQINNIINAALEYNKTVNIIYPNNDLGFENIINCIKTIKSNKIKIIKNLERDKFLRLLNETSILIGNSSCGIIEAPSFKLRVVNIGTRQNGRPKAKNIINSSYEKKNIIKSINYSFNNKLYIKKLNNTKNLFYKKNSGLKIAKLIIKILTKKSKLLSKY